MFQKGKLWVISLLTLAILGTVINLQGMSSKSTPTLRSFAPYITIKRDQIPSYLIDMIYHENTKKVTGNMKVMVPNRTTKPLDELYFHLYPNAFANWKWEEVTKPKTNGYLKVIKASINQIEAFPHQKDTLLKLNLPIPLQPNKAAMVEITFELKLPTRGLRLNQTPYSAYLAQWYPMLAVVDNQGWHIDPYTTTGDPFFSEIADFKVHVQVPEGYTVISSANDPHHEVANEKQVTLSQQKIRDFAMVITKEYESISGITKDGVKTNLWYLSDQQAVAPLLLGAATDAMQFFNESFGSYPMKEIDIVLANSGYGIAGMEYPGLVTSDAYIEEGKKKWPAYHVVAHELAHQWWYSTVGNNQIEEPWLDEGLTSFSEYLYTEQVLKRKNIDVLMKKIKQTTDQLSAEQNVSVLQSIYSYGDLYGLFIYARPAAMLWELKEEFGDQKVKELLQTYYKNYRFKIASTEDFIQTANTVFNKDMSPFFNQWLITR
ncbi:M1 family metallopeptidase [Tepidibacillus infernus]|uniref:M1 family metallopeptidase n=1 Tax=Tepidibacillus infernus TaxID=1806172 RepID=UPI003A1F7836